MPIYCVIYKTYSPATLWKPSLIRHLLSSTGCTMLYCSWQLAECCIILIPMQLPTPTHTSQMQPPVLWYWTESEISVMLNVRHFPSDVALHPRRMETSNFRSLLNTSVARYLTPWLRNAFQCTCEIWATHSCVTEGYSLQNVTLCHLLNRSRCFKAL